MAGYSGTPLIQKLGIKAGMKACFLNVPKDYYKLLGPLPEDLIKSEYIHPRKMDFIHFFAATESDLRKEFPELMQGLASNGSLWISWPKKSSKKFKSDLDENIIRNYALDSGLVDVKVCAIDDDWSGLKLVIPVKNR